MKRGTSESPGRSHSRCSHCRKSNRCDPAAHAPLIDPPPSSIINIPGESTLRRDFLRLQLANKERSELIRRQQLEQQQNEEHKRQLLAERQKRIEEQKEQRRRLEEVCD